MTWNINGLRSKWQQATEYIRNMDIVSIQETKLDANVSFGSLILDGYTVNRLDRNSAGGGVITYFKEILLPKVITAGQKKMIEYGIEATVNSIQLKKPTRSIVVIGVYRPPNAPADWFIKFNEVLTELSSIGPICILGDLNADMMKPTIYPTKSLLATFDLADVSIFKVVPTRITFNTATCLDIIALPPELLCTEYRISSLAISDHFPVEARINISLHAELQPVLKRSFNKVDFAKLGLMIGKITLDTGKGLSPDFLLDSWHSSVFVVLDELVPIKKYPMRKHKSKWMNEEIKDMIHLRNTIAKKLIKDGVNAELFAKLKILKKRVKSSIRAVIKAHGHNLFLMKDTKNAWGFIREVTFTSQRAEKVGMDLKLLNNALADSVTAPVVSTLELISGCDIIDAFKLKKMECKEIQQLLSNLKEKTATGHDCLPAFVLKKIASNISPNITKIINESFSQNYFPKIWKRANVVPVWKNKGSKSDTANYRPISILPVLARMVEKIVAKQLSSFCEERSVIPVEQYGFRPKSSCEHALITAVDSWMCSIDQGKFAGAILIDLSKAFDSVPHQLLLLELFKIGCSLDVVEWFQSYLSCREQRVVQANEVTEWKSVSRGFPQGSGLSPKLFNIFVRDLPAASNTPTIQFADDITHSVADSDPIVLMEKLADTFQNTKEFCESHGLTINASKTQLIIFKGPRKKIPDDLQMVIGGCIIKPENSVKLLGVTLDHHLTFGMHIQNVVKKCHGLIGVLSRAAPHMSRDLLKMAYTALIRSHLEFSSVIFSTAAPTQLKKLDTVQKIASRVICGVNRDAHSAPLQLELNLESLETRRTKHASDLVHSIVEGNCHPAFYDWFKLNENGQIKNKLKSRIKIGERRFGVFGQQLMMQKKLLS